MYNNAHAGVAKPRVYLSKTDCIIFVETCMNLALTVKKYGKEADFEKL